jgi:ATP-binding cassette subfamily B (MDR/TAP) protein 1
MSTTDAGLDLVGALAAVGAGTVLPLMALVFGSFVSKFAKFGAGLTTPAIFRTDVNSIT